MSKLLIGGEWVPGASAEALRDKFTGEPYGEMAVASLEQVDEAVAGLLAAQRASTLTPYDRYRILSRAACLVEERLEEFVSLMRAEAGLTRADVEAELTRCVQTLELCAEEAKRLVGEMVPMGGARGSSNRAGFTIRVPRGVVCAITPFNAPLNIVAHKVGPAIAGGNAVILKPSEFTPLTAVAFCRILLEAGLPPGLLALVHGEGRALGSRLLANQAIAFYAFTGSTRVGLEIQRAAGVRGTQLELGSISSTIVCADANIAQAVPKIANASFRKAGQVCTSIQKLLVDRRVAADLVPRVVAAAAALKSGDPAQKDTVIGPMISKQHADRAMSWIDEAVTAGARIATGGERRGNVIAPTVLLGVNSEMKVVCEEIFAPVLSVIEFDTIDEAVAIANDQPFGLAVGVFTNDVGSVFRLGPRLQFGGIHINETSSSRVDAMPFGGVKSSGYGREGPAYAIREMTEERLITVTY